MFLRAAVALLAAFPLLAAIKTDMTWAELGTLTGRQVRLPLSQGVVVRGTLQAVQPEALLFQVRQTTDPAAYPKGIVRIPRSQVTVLVVSSKAKVFRVLGTAAGGCIGFILGAVTAWSQHIDHGAASATVIGFSAGVGGLGYYLGNLADRRTTTVVVRR